jgi:hypothetical protein
MKEQSRISPNFQKETVGHLGFQGHALQYRQDKIWAQPNRIVQTGWFREERPRRQKQNTVSSEERFIISKGSKYSS